MRLVRLRLTELGEHDRESHRGGCCHLGLFLATGTTVEMKPYWLLFVALISVFGLGCSGGGGTAEDEAEDAASASGDLDDDEAAMEEDASNEGEEE